MTDEKKHARFDLAADAKQPPFDPAEAAAEAARYFQDHGPQLMENHRRMFGATKNPLWVVDAYVAARKYMAAVPDWILEEHDRMWARVQDAETVAVNEHFDPDGARARSDWKSAITTALGFTERNPFIARWSGFGFDYARRVRVLCADGHNETDAQYLVSRDCGVSKETVRRAWLQFRAVVETGDLKRQREEIEFIDRERAGLRKEPDE